ncbi:MAG: hypothetical protein HY078_07325 [Elusimicrobia bacterium]|nr:hypothetical protein [Elusimicrobiota bacterium]
MPRILASAAALLLIGSLCSAAPSATPAPAPAKAALTGKIIWDQTKINAPDLSKVLVYLKPLDPAYHFDPPRTSYVISQKQVKFTPEFAVVVQGQTVDFPNDDTMKHNVYSFSEPKWFDLGVYSKGEKKSVTFDRAGLVSIHCSIHELMNGTIFVVPAPFYTMTDAAGNYTIDGVSPGRYELQTWHPILPTFKKQVEVAPGGTSTDISATKDLVTGGEPN